LATEVTGEAETGFLWLHFDRTVCFMGLDAEHFDADDNASDVWSNSAYRLVEVQIC